MVAPYPTHESLNDANHNQIQMVIPPSPDIRVCVRWQVGLPNLELCWIWIMPFQGRSKWGNWFWLQTKSKSNFAIPEHAVGALCTVHLARQEGKIPHHKKSGSRLPIRFSSFCAVKSQSGIRHPLVLKMRQLGGFPPNGKRQK